MLQQADIFFPPSNFCETTIQKNENHQAAITEFFLNQRTNLHEANQCWLNLAVIHNSEKYVQKQKQPHSHVLKGDDPLSRSDESMFPALFWSSCNLHRISLSHTSGDIEVLLCRVLVVTTPDFGNTLNNVLTTRIRVASCNPDKACKTKIEKNESTYF